MHNGVDENMEVYLCDNKVNYGIYLDEMIWGSMDLVLHPRKGAKLLASKVHQLHTDRRKNVIWPGFLRKLRELNFFIQTRHETWLTEKVNSEADLYYNNTYDNYVYMHMYG